MNTKFSLAEFRTELNDIWSKFDGLYTSLQPGAWDRKFGKDWTFADQPYHMSFIDDMVARNISAGESLPEVERVLANDESKLSSWNAERLAKRPAGQSGPQSLDQWKRSRQAIMDAISRFTEADLDRKAWLPVYMGWVDARTLLGFSLVHAVGEYSELMMRLKKRGPLPTSKGINLRYDLLMGVMPLIMKKEAAKGVALTAVMTFTGPGAGSWTINVKDGACQVSAGRPGKRDVEMTTTFLGFEKLGRKMGNPMLMMLTRQLKVSGMGKMGTFGKIFPM